MEDGSDDPVVQFDDIIINVHQLNKLISDGFQVRLDYMSHTFFFSNLIILLTPCRRYLILLLDKTVKV